MGGRQSAGHPAATTLLSYLQIVLVKADTQLTDNYLLLVWVLMVWTLTKTSMHKSNNVESWSLKKHTDINL